LNHAQICSWNQPVQSNEETTEAFDGARTHDWPIKSQSFYCATSLHFMDTIVYRML